MDERERQSQAAQIGQLLQEVAAFPDPQQRAKTEDLLRNLLDLYGTGLARLLEITAQANVSGLQLIETFAQDELVGSLLLLHGLHPVELETRLLQAVGGVRASVQKRGGTIEFERMEDGVAYLRVTGVGHGCASAALTQLIEEAMYSAAPDLEDVRLQEVAAPKPVKFMPTRRRKDDAATSAGDNTSGVTTTAR